MSASSPPRFPDLGRFVTYLERTGRLRRIRVEVDPVIEVPEIMQRVVRERGPALLFERPKGSAYPLVMNLFGSMERLELALGRHPIRDFGCGKRRIAPEHYHHFMLGRRDAFRHRPLRRCW